MKKQLLFLAFVIVSLTGFAQSASVEYFEVYTKLAHSKPGGGFSFNRDSIMARINSVPDTAGTIATFVLSTNNPVAVDSLFFTLKNSQNQSVYTGALKVSTLQSNPAYKLNGKTMYFTVCPYSYLKQFTATVKVRGNDGKTTPVKSFAKN